MAFPTTHANGEIVDATWANDLENRAAAAIAAASGAVTVVSPGNLGASQTINFAGAVGETWLAGTLNANCTVTLSNRVAGCRARLLLTQDGTGGRTLTVSDGSLTQPVPIATIPGQFTEVLILCPDASNLNVTVIGGTGGSWAQREQQKFSAIGLKGQTFDIFGIYSAVNLAPTSQTLFGTLVGLLASDVVTNVYICVGATAVGTQPTGIFLGLYSTGGALLASTADLHASAIWTGGNKVVQAAFSSPYTVTASGGYYLAFLQNGTWGTTALQLLRGNQTAATLGTALSGGVTPAVTQTGQATLPSTATFTSGATTNYWFGWS